MSIAPSLLPAPATTRSSAGARVGTATALDAVHDHVLRLLGDSGRAAVVVADVARRATARWQELGAAPSTTDLLRSAHARLVHEPRQQPEDAVLARLGGQHPAGRQVTLAATSGTGPGVALLDLTVRHGQDLRTAADLVGVSHDEATDLLDRARRAAGDALARTGVRTDLDATLRDLPVVGAPTGVHALLDVPADARPRRVVPPGAAWLGTAAVGVLTLAALGLGLPRAAALAGPGDAPVAVAVAVDDAALLQPVDGTGELDAEGGPVEELVVEPAPAAPVAPSVDEPKDAAPAPQDEPTEDAATDDGSTTTDEEPGDEASPEPEPEPEPSGGPIELPLPTGP